MWGETRRMLMGPAATTGGTTGGPHRLWAGGDSGA